MIQAFMTKLFLRYTAIMKRGSIAKEPEQVTKATKVYRAKNDVYMNFINERIKDDPESHLMVSDMYSEFKEWYRSSYSNLCNISKPEFKDYFEKCYKQRYRTNRVMGVRYVREEDDDVVIILTNP